MKRNDVRSIIARRFASARMALGLSQEDVAAKMGFKDRQIVSNIESEKRSVSAEELILAGQIFNKPYMYFMDPYILDEKISWRTDGQNVDITEFKKKAENILASYVRFADLLGKTANPIEYCLQVNKKTSYEAVSSMADTLVNEWRLGNIPAENLYQNVKDNLKIEILNLDCPEKVSGGACRIDNYRIIFISINEPYYRRNFNLAHELFHILTWNQLEPRELDFYNELEDDNIKHKPREEQLADRFASALLMPTGILTKLWENRNKSNITEWLNTTAETLRVAAIALYWRLYNMGCSVELATVNKGELSCYGKDKSMIHEPDQSKMLSDTFLENINDVLEKGLVSIKKMSDLLDMPEDDILDMIQKHGKQSSYERQRQA